MAARERLTATETQHIRELKHDAKFHDREQKHGLDKFRGEERVANTKAEERYAFLMKTVEKSPEFRAHTFQKGMTRHPNAGRRAGTPNKITQIMRVGVERAAIAAGYVYVDRAGRHRATGKGGFDAYMLSLAENHPNIFSKLIIALFAAEVNGKNIDPENKSRVYRTVSEMRDRMHELGVPIPAEMRKIIEGKK